MKYETPSETLDLLYQIVDELEGSALHHATHGDETFIQCKICGEWESHKRHCPIDTIHGFLASIEN